MNVDQVIRIVATKGPVLPIQVVKELGGNTMFAGAMLSQLIDQKRVFVSHVKVGGSPLYYVKGQEARLQEYQKHLNEKDRATYDLLKQGKVLRDSDQSPLVRVSLRNIKDFAVPLEVTFGDEKEIFWKWYLLNDDDAREMIGIALKKGGKKEAAAPVEPAAPKGREERQDAEKPLQSFVSDKKEAVQEKKEEPVLNLSAASGIKTAANDNFLGKITNFLKSKSIVIKNFEVKKKNLEIDLTLLVPSAVGHIEYYCRAKNKKRLNDSDLSSAYVQGQLRKLPSMVLTTGELTKKAKELLSREIKISMLKM